MLEGLEVPPGTIFDCGDRPSSGAIDVFRRVGVSNVASALGGPLATQRLIDAHAIPRVSGSGVVAGFAVTIWHPPGSNGMLMGALDLVQPGDILVVCGPSEVAQWGDIATTLAIAKGLAGAVVDGAVRDIDTIREMGFALWGSRVYAGQGYRKDAGYVNVPIVVKGLLVHPGDVVVADSDGILSIPGALVNVAHERSVARERIEHAVADEARQGRSGHHGFEISSDLMTQLTGPVRSAGTTWANFLAGSQRET